MAKNRLAGVEVAVLGLGREGLDLVKFLIGHRANVTVLDRNQAGQLGESYAQAKKLGAKFILGSEYLERLSDFEIIFRSPGVSLQTPELKLARRRGVEISSAVKLFFELCPAKIVGITGTKGKSTTTSLIFHLLKRGRRRVFMAGNIGESPLHLLKKLRPTDLVVLELSSFQLEDMDKSPNIAVMLNVVPEHLDRHRTFKKYLAAKQNIYLHQNKADWLVVSRDFAVPRQAAKSARGKVFPYSVGKILPKGLYVARQEIVLRDLTTGRRQVVIGLNEIKLIGEHNLQNVLPAIGVALISGLSVRVVRTAVTSFQALTHRLEPAYEKDGVVFVDDSLGTTPEAAAAAIKAFAWRDTAIILGGVYKGGSLKLLMKILAENPVKLVALIGESQATFARALHRYAPKVPVKKCGKDFEKAITAAYQSVKTRGGAVLLSPACASQDMFQNAYERGRQFVSTVHRLYK